MGQKVKICILGTSDFLPFFKFVFSLLGRMHTDDMNTDFNQK